MSSLDYSDQSVPTVLSDDEWPAGVALAGVLAGVHGADHEVGDGAGSISGPAGLLAGDGHVHLLEHGGLVAPAAEGAPARHGGGGARVGSGGGCGEARRAHGGAEGDRLGQAQDGVVAVGALGVVVGVLDELCHIHPGEGVVAGDVLAEQDLDGRRGLAVGAVGRREDVLGGDESAAAVGGATVGPDKRNLPWVLVLLGGLPAHNPSVSCSSLLAALALARRWGCCCGPRAGGCCGSRTDGHRSGGQGGSCRGQGGGCGTAWSPQDYKGLRACLPYPTLPNPTLPYPTTSRGEDDT